MDIAPGDRGGLFAAGEEGLGSFLGTGAVLFMLLSERPSFTKGFFGSTGQDTEEEHVTPTTECTEKATPCRRSKTERNVTKSVLLRLALAFSQETSTP